MDEISSATACSAEDLAQWVEQTASRYGHPAPRITWKPRQQWSDSTRKGAEIALDPGLLADVDVVRMVAGHELGHIVLGHLPYLTRRRVMAVLAGAATIWAIIGPVIAAEAVWGGTWLPWSLVAAIPAAFAAMFYVLHVVFLPCQRCEFSADRFAADNGYRLTSDLRRRHIALMPPPRESAILALTRWVIPTHPTWPQRLAALQEPRP